MPEKSQSHRQSAASDQEFKHFLVDKQINLAGIEQAVDLIIRFEQQLGKAARQAGGDDIRSFINLLANEKNDTEENLTFLYYYGKFSKNNAIALASLELLDGGEVMQNLHKKIGTNIDTQIRDKIFAGIDLPSFGAPQKEKARCMQVVMERFEKLVEPGIVRQILSDCLRDLSEGTHQENKKLYEQLGDFDAFLDLKRHEYVHYLEGFKERGELYYTQEITDEVVAFVRDNPEVAQGVRVGSILYITKIPYMTKEYLAEQDEQKKRYYYCHCPWARETLKHGEKVVSSTFCHCSAGFVKKPWEVILGQKLEADILESILQGDLRCRFAIHLPEGLTNPI
jgi:hypothetical protein